MLGPADETRVGMLVGNEDGDTVELGIDCGLRVGALDGNRIGEALGRRLGDTEGEALALDVGSSEGRRVGVVDGASLGTLLGATVARPDGALVGSRVGDDVVSLQMCAQMSCVTASMTPAYSNELMSRKYTLSVSRVTHFK